jgi:hypothetical protein
MLDQAQMELEKRSAELAAALAQLKPFADTGCYEQVLALVQFLPARTAAALEVEALRRAAEESWREERSQLEILGRAYAALASNPPSLVPVTERATKSQPLIAMRKMFLGHRRSAVDAILTTQITHIQKARAESLPVNPASQLADSQKLLPFASDKVKAEWSATAGQYRSNNGKMDKLFGRLGKGKGKRKP